MSDRAASRGWTGAPSAAEATALLVLVAGIAYLLLGPAPPLPAPPAAPAVPALRVETGAEERPIARVDDEALRAAFARAGLPDPPALDGGDPVPVRAILALLERWIETGDRAAVADLGRVFLALEKPQAALQHFAALRGLEPDEPRWAYLLGVAAQALGLETLAIESFEAARGSDPDYAVTHARLGTLHLERGELDAAERAFDACVARAPAISLGAVGLARVALARGDAAAAETWARRAIGITPNDYRAHRLLGQALSGQGRVDEAGAARALAEQLPQYAGWLVFDERLQEAHALANSQRNLENQLRLLQGSNDHAAIAAISREILERRPRDYLTIAMLAKAEIGLEQLDAAQATIERGLAIEPEFVTLLTLGAQVDMLRKRYPEALARLDAAIAIDPRDPSAHDVRGRVLFLSERFDEALEAMRRAIALDPGRSGVARRYARAEMLIRLGRREEAIVELRALLEVAPGVRAAERRLQQLTAGK